VDHLFGLLREAFDGVIPATLTGAEVSALAAAFADGIRRFVTFAAEHPELNQIMVHEGTATERPLEVDDRNAREAVLQRDPTGWQVLRKAGVAAPIESEVLYYVLLARILALCECPRSSASHRAGSE